jgi:hypothetical protein
VGGPTAAKKSLSITYVSGLRSLVGAGFVVAVAGAQEVRDGETEDGEDEV